MIKTPLISVIVPIYKVEKYLEETIISVINQSIGFKDNIELIIVNDGSPDKSGDICKKYQEKFFDNIVYIEKENGGVSSARNEGAKYARGKYINFLDSDDKWAVDAFEKIIMFFNAHYDETDVVCCPMTRFDGADNQHKLTLVFKNGTRVADLNSPDEANTLHVHVTSSVFKRDAINDVSFKDGMRYGEDTLFVESVVIKKCTLGLCSEAVHYYRRRSDNSSAIQNQKTDKSYYTDVPKEFYGGLIEASKNLYGKVIPYIQLCISYDMGWRVASPYQYDLTDDEKACYVKSLHDILQYVDDRYILKSIFHKKLHTKLAQLNIKYSHDCKKDFYVKDGVILFNSYRIASIKNNKSMFYVDSVKGDNGLITVNGRISNWVLNSFDKVAFMGACDNKEIVPRLVSSKDKIDINMFCESERFSDFSFTAEIKMGCVAKIGFLLLIDGEKYTLGANFEKDFEPYKVFGDCIFTISRCEIEANYPKKLQKELKRMDKLRAKNK